MSWKKKSESVRLNSYQKKCLDALAKKLSFDIVVTSGIRSPEEQARAMIAKLQRGEDLTKIYKDDVFAIKFTSLYNSGTIFGDLVKFVQEYRPYPSRHLAGLAIDLRSSNAWGYTHEMRNDMYAASKELGFSPFQESDHLHIGLPDQKKNSLIFLGILGLLWITKK